MTNGIVAILFVYCFAARAVRTTFTFGFQSKFVISNHLDSNKQRMERTQHEYKTKSKKNKKKTL